MTRMTVVASLCGAVGMAVLPGAALAQAYPERPIRWIVPYNPGGGTDSSARFLQQAIEANGLLPQPLALVNIAGAGGSIGAREAKDAPADGYTILIHQSALLIQDANGMSDFGLDDFEPVISLNNQCMSAAVRDDSPFQGYNELMEAATASPGSIIWGGNIGSANHMAISVMEDAAPGAEFMKVQIGGGAESFAALKGDIINVGNFGTGEILTFSGEDGIRALAILAEERDPSIPDVPTARELGHDAVFCNQHNLYAPKGTPPERIQVLADAFEAALSTEQVITDYRERLGATITIRRGDELREHLGNELERLRPMAEAM